MIRAEAGAVQFVFLRGEREVIAQRISGRKGHFMPPSLLDSQFAALEEPSSEENVWIVDIDDSPDAIAASLIARASA
jgi:gluconokinase